MELHRLTAPLSDESVGALKAGECFSLTGRVFTCRPLAYDRLLNSAEGKAVLKELSGLGTQALFHCGPLVKKDGEDWRILGMVPMPSWLAGPERISQTVRLLNLKMVIGKGSLHGMSDFCVKSHCVHAVCVGNFSDYASKVTKVLRSYWIDLGLPEALWVFDAQEIGPFIVETDADGKSLYKGIDEAFQTEAVSLLQELGIKLN